MIILSINLDECINWDLRWFILCSSFLSLLVPHNPWVPLIFWYACAKNDDKDKGGCTLPYGRHFHTGYDIFSLWFNEVWVKVHWITMKTCRNPYENACRTEFTTSLLCSMDTFKEINLRVKRTIKRNSDDPNKHFMKLNNTAISYISNNNWGRHVMLLSSSLVTYNFISIFILLIF